MNDKTRVLIVTYNWPPRNAMGTHRPYAWARHWSEAGAQVTVLTARKQFLDEPLDLHLPDLDGVRVIEVPYGAGRHAAASRLLRTPFILNYLRRLKAFLQKNSSKPIDPRIGWFKASIPLLNDLAVGHDVVVSTFGPNASHLIAGAIKRINPDIYWVADYRDLWDQHVSSTLSAESLNAIWEEHRQNVGEKADLITAVSEDMVCKLSEKSRCDVILAPNGFDVQEGELVEILKRRSSNSRSPLRIVHTGTVYRGHRDPTPLLEVLASMVDDGEIQPGDVFVDFYGRSVDPIRDLQKNPRISLFIRVFGHVSREEALLAQREADLLLLLESSDVESRGILTGKLFEYITAGRPIVCVGSSPEYEIGLVLRRTSTGKVVNRSDASEIRSVILEKISKKSDPAWFRPNTSEILKFSRKTQASDLLFNIENRSASLHV